MEATAAGRAFDAVRDCAPAMLENASYVKGELLAMRAASEATAPLLAAPEANG